MTNTRVRFDSSPIVFDGGAGSRGFFISDDPSDFDGWDDSPEMRRQAIDYAQAHGSYDLRGFKSSRVVTIGGPAYSRSPEDQQSMNNQFTGLLADGQRDRMIVDHQGLRLWANVRLQKPSFAATVYGEIAVYQLQVWAADPRKYSLRAKRFPTTGFVDAVSAYHRGNFPALPVYRISGNMPNGYGIWCGGQLYQVSRPVTPGHDHTVYMRTGKLWIDGAPVVGGLVHANTWTIPQGAPTDMTIDKLGGTGGMAVEVSDTYV
jgi:hypothetical protein